MGRKIVAAIISICLVALLCAAVSSAGAPAAAKSKTAIVLANFGTTVPTAVQSIVNIQHQVKTAFPEVPVKITFTSNIIRSVWKKRQADATNWLGRGIPAEVLYVKNVIATVGDLLEDGYDTIIVQPTHIFFMEQSHDLLAYIQALASIQTIKAKWKPFEKIVMGRPALGMPGDRYDYRDDLKMALSTLEGDVQLARKQGAMLVYMAHGNDYWSTGIYWEAQKAMRDMYPDVVTTFGAVEGNPGIDDVLQQLSEHGIGNVVLKPFMIVAGDHALNDMTGQDSGSWRNLIARKGFKVLPIMEGLGSNNGFAQIFVEHIRDAARDNGIALE